MSVQPPIEPRLPVLPVDDENWDWKAFERFSLGLVRAQPDVKDANLYGKPGEKQKGIDIEAALTDGRKRAYQCRKRRRFSKSDAEKLFAETSYKADEYVIVVTCPVGTAVRDYINRLPNWTLWDKEDIARQVRDIEPREKARALVDDTFGPLIRRTFLGPETHRVFDTPDEAFGPFLDEGRLFRHTWDLVGREQVALDLVGAVEDPDVRVAVLVGRGGIGKTRILKELSDRNDDSKRHVLFVKEGATLTDETVDETPLTETVIVLDDAHRRTLGELAPLLSLVRRRTDPLTLVIATRPQRTDELRGELGRASFAAKELWISEPVSDLETSDVEALARQALSEAFQSLAPELARATADCPLVTVFGGQLLSSEAIPPGLLERHDDFRAEVLERFREERIGNLKPEIDPDTARSTLVLLSALQPISVADGPTMERIAEDAGLDIPGLNVLLGELEDAGLLVSRGRLRRVVPDVLADHILHTACIDPQGRSTRKADQLLNRYAETALNPLLRNLSELDWRVGQAGDPVDLLGDAWDELTDAFKRGNAEARIRVIGLVGPMAYSQPDRVLDLVEYELANPAETVEHPLFGITTSDEEVRGKLPELLRSVAYSPTHTERAMGLLWILGRDDARETHPHPDHPIRAIQELGSYELPSLIYSEALLAFASTLIGKDEGHHWNPLRLLEPLLEREGTTIRGDGYRIRSGSYHVNPETTAGLRERLRSILKKQALEGSDESRLVAADLLGDALRQPHGFFEQEVPSKVRDGWLPDQRAILALIDEVFEETNDPLVRSKLRDGVRWHAERSAWPEIEKHAKEILKRPAGDDELIVGVIADPWAHVLDEADRKARLAEAAAKLVSREPGVAVEQVEIWTNRLAAAGGRPDPGQIVQLAAAQSPTHGEAFARRGMDEPQGILAAQLPGVLAQLRRKSPKVHDEILGAVSSRKELRPLVASYTANRVFDGLTDEEAQSLADFLTDESTQIVRIALHGLIPLSSRDPERAKKLALGTDIGGDSECGDLLCASITHSNTKLSEDERKAILAKLTPVPELEYHARQFLVGTAAENPSLSIDFMLERISRAGEDDFNAVPFHDFDGSLLGPENGEGTNLLRRVRDAMATDDSLIQLETVRFFWKLSRNLDEHLLVIHEGLASRDPKKIEQASELLSEMPWGVLLAKPFFVSDVLERAKEVGDEALQEVRSGLASAAIRGNHSRTMGEPSPRDVSTASEAGKNIELFPAGSLAPEFFQRMVARAEQSIKESRLEDEEIGEG